jgi:protein LTV1
MPKKKKQFIDKKAGQTFSIVHRSQRDEAMVADPENTTPMVLVPKKGGNSTASSAAAMGIETGGGNDGGGARRGVVNSLGMEEDGYNYEQHIRPMTGQGMFVPKGGKAAPSNKAAAFIPDDAVLPKEDTGTSLMEAVAISARLTTSDMRAVLEGRIDFDDEAQQLDDDFVQQADQPTGDEAAEAFDFDAHIAMLMARAENPTGWHGSDEEGEELTDDEEDAEFIPCEEFEGQKRGFEFKKGDWGLGYYSTGTQGGGGGGGGGGRGGGGGSGREMTEEERRALDAQFSATLAEYEEDEIGELEHPMDDERLAGHMEEGDELLEGILDSYLAKEASEKHASGLGEELGAPLSRGMLKEATAEEVAGLKLRELSLAQRAWESQEAVQKGEFNELLVKEMPYFKRKTKAAWDCESIISTLSNLDNRPSIIGEAPTHRPASIAAESSASSAGNRPQEVRVRLSAKTGMPVGYVGRVGSVPEGEEGEESEEDEGPAVNLGEKRDKKESKDTKKARKAAVKAERQQRRVAKKEMQGFFAEESASQKRTGGGAGTSVFTYS